MEKPFLLNQKKKYVHIRCSSMGQEPSLQLRDISSMTLIENSQVIQENLSAFKDNVARPVLDKLKKDIAANKVSELYVWHLDRLFRNRKKLIEFLAFCKLYNTKVFSYNQRWLETINDIPAPFNEIMFDMMISIMGWIAESESETKSKRVKMAIKKSNDGITYSTYGNKWGRKAFPKQTTDRVIRLYNDGLSIREIAKQVQVYDLNNNGRQISIGAVHKIIKLNSLKIDS